jgi:hypothetical protein
MGEKSFWANMAIGFLLSQTMGSKGAKKEKRGGWLFYEGKKMDRKGGN